MHGAGGCRGAARAGTVPRQLLRPHKLVPGPCAPQPSPHGAGERRYRASGDLVPKFGVCGAALPSVV